MSKLTHFPHISSSTAARPMNYFDPMHGSIFEVVISKPAGIPQETGITGEDFKLLTEQVVSVSGLDALQKTSAAGEQKFFGASASYLNPTLDNTYAEITIEFNLNIRNANDAYVFRIFKEWSKLGYDITTGARSLMKDYVSDNIIISEANRDGTVWRTVKLQKVMLTEVTGLDGLDYTNNEARKLSVKFRSDIWEETIERGISVQ